MADTPNQTADLPGRLRAVACGMLEEANFSDWNGNRVGLLRQSADEIERLHARVLELEMAAQKGAQQNRQTEKDQ